MEMRELIPFYAQVSSSVGRLISYAQVKDITQSYHNFLSSSGEIANIYVHMSPDDKLDIS